MSSLNGVLPVDKPVGPTSHDVVSVARRSLGVRRIGHSGTLDPFASGLLLLCVGPATRLSEYLTGLPKSYTATLRLGVVTDTDDLQGRTLSTDDGWKAITSSQIEEALETQRGEILQLPPRYSAKKVDGERMYAVARAGGDVRAKAAKVTVFRLEVTRIDLPDIELEVECSSGTYIRAIARDVGERLGVGAHLTVLRRTRIGRYDVAVAVGLEQLADSSRVANALLTPADAVADLPSVVLAAPETGLITRGGSIPATSDVPTGTPIAFLTPAGELLAIGERRGDRLQPRKVFA